MPEKKAAIRFGALAFLLLIGLAAWQWSADASAIQAWIRERPVLGAGVYILILAATVVLMPLASLPLLPFAVATYGMWLTAFLSTVGWWVGAIAAFSITRWGRRGLERIAPLKRMRGIEERIPEDVGFCGAVLLHMFLPVELVSYSLGFLKRLRFRVYAVAALLGIFPFAILWSYAGGQLEKGRMVSFALIVSGILLAVLMLRQLWRRLH